jgi:lysophospholipase L1-like esterase
LAFLDTDYGRFLMRLILNMLAVAAMVVFAASQRVHAETPTTQPAENTAADATSSVPEAAQPVEGKTNGEKWWRGKFEGINANIKKMEGKIDVAIVGDSITARWGGESWQKHWGSYRAVNMGIGGDRTQNVIWRLQNGQLDGYEGRLFIVMIGTNNLWGKTPSAVDTAAGVKAIIDLIQAKQPKAKILLLSIFPRGEKPNPGREVIKEVNAIISKYEGGPVHYMDIGDKFLEPDGTISKEVMHDSLHLAPKGYDIWAEAINAKVKELLGETPAGN